MYLVLGLVSGDVVGSLMYGALISSWPELGLSPDGKWLFFTMGFAAVMVVLAARMIATLRVAACQTALAPYRVSRACPLPQGAFVAYHLGDVAWLAGTAFLGSYFAVLAAIKLLVPMIAADIAVEFGLLYSYRPSFVGAANMTSVSWQSVAAEWVVVSRSVFLWGPILAVLGLACLGVLVQCRLLRRMQYLAIT